MKHFVQVAAPINRSEKFLLITESGEEFQPFNIAMKNMARQGYSENTIEQYAGHIARFIDYIYVAGEYLPDSGTESLMDAVYSYRSYLLFGEKSADELARKIAKELRPGRITSEASLLPIGAAIKYFLTLSDVVALASNQETLFDNISTNKRRKLSESEKRAIKRNSTLGGVLRGGAKLISGSGGVFGRVSKNSSGPKSKKPMPYNKVGELIEAAKSYRDKAFYSFLAASGCRQHEALQIRIEDIDFDRRTVELISPFSRDMEDLSESETKMLSWKGRATSTTFLIEPFKSAFFEFLEQYFRHERIAHSANSYVFQRKDGRPYFTSARQSRAETFRALKKKIGLGGEKYITAHSIRHTYGTYTLNYLPLQDSFGLPITVVRLLMGHSSLSSTEVYARQDEELALAQIEYANEMIHTLDGTKSLDEIRISYHKNQINEILRLADMNDKDVEAQR